MVLADIQEGTKTGGAWVWQGLEEAAEKPEHTGNVVLRKRKRKK